MKVLATLLFAILTSLFGAAQQDQTPVAAPENASSASKPAVPKKDKAKKEPAVSGASSSDKTTDSAKPAETPKADSEATDKDKDEHYDVAEVPPVVTHHQITLNGKTLSYTATTGRLPLKRPDGKIEGADVFCCLHA